MSHFVVFMIFLFLSRPDYVVYIKSTVETDSLIIKSTSTNDINW